MGNFARVLHHLDMKDVKKRHLREHAARRIKEEQDKKEKKVIQEIAKKYKSDWRKDLEEDFTNITTGNKVGQTFRHDPTGATFTSSGGLGGVESTPKTVTLDLGLDGKFTVDAPTYDQLALAGYAKPIVMQNKKLEDTNPKLDASQEFAKKVGADYMMNARVKDAISSALSDDLGYKSAEDILAEVGDVWTYEEYMEMMNAIGDRAAAASLPITKEILQYGPGGTKTGDVPISLIDAQEAITNARTKAEAALTAAWERYNKIPEPQDGFGGGQGNPTNRRGSGFDRKGALDSSGYGMDPSRDTETEARPVENDEDGKARVDKFNKEVENIQKFNDKMRENNINKIKEYIKSLKLNVTYEQLLKKGAIKTKGGIVAIDDAGKGNIRVGVFKGSDVYTKDKFVFHHGDKYTSEIESFNTEEGVKEIPTMPDVLQKWQSAYDSRNPIVAKNLTFPTEYAKEIVSDIKKDLITSKGTTFRPSIGQKVLNVASVALGKVLQTITSVTAETTRGVVDLRSPANMMLAYNEFAVRGATGKGSSPDNPVDANNIISTNDTIKLKKDMIKSVSSNISPKAIENFKSGKDTSGLLYNQIKSAFGNEYMKNVALRVTFGGTGGVQPVVTIENGMIVARKQYGFRKSGSAEELSDNAKIIANLLGIPHDTTGAGGITDLVAPIAAKVGMQGDDIHARYYNSLTPQERGKPTDSQHSIYNVPDMHYEYKIPLSSVLNPILNSTKSSKSKTVERIKSMSKARNQSLSLDEPIVRRKKKRG